MMVGVPGIIFGLAAPTSDSILAELATILGVIFLIGLLGYAVTTLLIRRAKE